jgi:hypothetical protein
MFKHAVIARSVVFGGEQTDPQQNIASAKFQPSELSATGSVKGSEVMWCVIVITKRVTRLTHLCRAGAF